MLRRAAVLKRICDRRRAQNARRRTGENFAVIKDELYKEFFKEAESPFSYSI